jgi:murein DD-endopeptidase MepM/ murein hydrolase activator NlpD
MAGNAGPLRPGDPSDGGGSRAARRAVQVASRQLVALVVRTVSWKLALLRIGLALAPFVLFVLVAIFMAMAGAGAQQNAGAAGGVAGSCVLTPSGDELEHVAELKPIYDAAASSPKYPLGPRGWAVLAGINHRETDFGQNVAVSSAGAVGWMQFMPATWEQYKIDADGGGADPDNKHDAIHSAANYLHALLQEAWRARTGSDRPDSATGDYDAADWHAAVWGYNHLESYIDDVLRDADAYQGQCSSTSVSGDVAAASPGYPLAIHGTGLGGVAAHQARPFGNWQSDNAVDIGVPRGTTVLAVGSGTVLKLGGSWDGTGRSNPNGYNVTLQTVDNTWFYTHLIQRAPGLAVGDHVTVGQVLGLSGAANGVDHLHIGSLRGDPEKLLGV